jgi:flagellar motor component MotA
LPNEFISVASKMSVYYLKGEDMKSGFIGMFLVFGLIRLAIALGVGNGFFNVPSLVICIGLPIGLSLASAGAGDTRNALRALRSLLVLPPPADITVRNSQVLRHMISYAYAAGVIGTMLGWIQMLRHIKEPLKCPLS